MLKRFIKSVVVLVALSSVSIGANTPDKTQVNGENQSVPQLMSTTMSTTKKMKKTPKLKKISESSLRMVYRRTSDIAVDNGVESGVSNELKALYSPPKLMDSLSFHLGLLFDWQTVGTEIIRSETTDEVVDISPYIATELSWRLGPKTSHFSGKVVHFYIHDKELQLVKYHGASSIEFSYSNKVRHDLEISVSSGLTHHYVGYEFDPTTKKRTPNNELNAGLSLSWIGNYGLFYKGEGGYKKIYTHDNSAIDYFYHGHFIGIGFSGLSLNVGYISKLALDQRYLTQSHWLFDTYEKIVSLGLGYKLSF